jgi:transposase
MRDGTWRRSTFQRSVSELRPAFRAALVAGTRCACPKTAATCREVLKVESALWTFVRVDGVEPTNNAAERALRHAVQWRKTSYGTESATGSHFVEHILTVIAPCRQQHRNLLEYLTQCCQARDGGTPPPFRGRDFTLPAASREFLSGCSDAQVAAKAPGRSGLAEDDAD